MTIKNSIYSMCIWLVPDLPLFLSASLASGEAERRPRIALDHVDLAKFLQLAPNTGFSVGPVTLSEGSPPPKMSYITQCDGITDMPDVVEASCDAYRLQVLQDLNPLIKDNLASSNSMSTSSDALSAASQDMLSHAGNLTEALFGKGGTPTMVTGGLFKTPQKLIPSIISEAGLSTGSLDAYWADVANLSKWAGDASQNITAQYATSVANLSSAISRSQTGSTKYLGAMLSSVLDGINEQATEVATTANLGNLKIARTFSDTKFNSDFDAMSRTVDSLGEHMDQASQAQEDFGDSVQQSIDSVKQKADAAQSAVGATVAGLIQSESSVREGQFDNKLGIFESASTSAVAGFNNDTSVSLASASAQQTSANSSLWHTLGLVSNTSQSLMDRMAVATNSSLSAADSGLAHLETATQVPLDDNTNSLGALTDQLKSFDSDSSQLSGEMTQSVRDQSAAVGAQIAATGTTQADGLSAAYSGLLDQLGRSQADTSALLLQGQSSGDRRLLGAYQNSASQQTEAASALSDAASAVSLGSSASDSAMAAAESKVNAARLSASFQTLGSLNDLASSISQGSASVSAMANSVHSEVHSAVQGALASGLAQAQSAGTEALAQTDSVRIKGIQHSQVVLGAASTAGAVLASITSAGINTQNQVNTFSASTESVGSSTGFGTLGDRLGDVEDSIADSIAKSGAAQSSLLSGSLQAQTDSGVNRLIGSQVTTLVNGPLARVSSQVDASSQQAQSAVDSAEHFFNGSVSDVNEIQNRVNSLARSHQTTTDAIASGASNQLDGVEYGSLSALSRLAAQYEDRASALDSKVTGGVNSKITNGAASQVTTHIASIRGRVDSAEKGATGTKGTLAKIGVEISGLQGPVSNALQSYQGTQSRIASFLGPTNPDISGLLTFLSQVNSSTILLNGSAMDELHRMSSGYNSSLTKEQARVHEALDRIESLTSMGVSDLMTQMNLFMANSSLSGFITAAGNRSVSSSALTAISAASNIMSNFSAQAQAYQNQSTHIGSSAVAALGSSSSEISQLLDSAQGLQATGASNGSNITASLAATQSLSTTAMLDAATATTALNSQLKSDATKALGNTQFQTALAASQAQQAMVLARSDVQASTRAASDSIDSIGRSMTQSQSQVLAVNSLLGQAQIGLQQTFANMKHSIAASGLEFAANSSMDEFSRNVTLGIVRRLLQNLLSVWNSAASYVTEAASTMNSSDAHLGVLMAAKVNRLGIETINSIARTNSQLDRLEAQIVSEQSSLDDQASRVNATAQTLDDAGSSLITATNNTISQLYQSAVDMDLQDANLDAQMRNSSLSVLQDFQATLQQRLAAVINSTVG